MQYLSFCDWLMSLSFMSSRLINVVACVRFSFFFKKIDIYWSIIASQYCICFCCTTKWIHISPYPLPLESPSHPPYPSPLGHRKAPSWSPCTMLLLPTSYFTFGSVHTSMLLSLRPSFPLPPRVLKSILYVYIFIPALPLGSSVPFF